MEPYVSPLYAATTTNKKRNKLKQHLLPTNLMCSNRFYFLTPIYTEPSVSRFRLALNRLFNLFRNKLSGSS